MTTYKQFLLTELNGYFYPYLDHQGSLMPMFPGTIFRSMQQVETRINQYWNEWGQYEQKRKVDLAKSFEILKASTDLHDEQQQLDQDKWNEKVEQYEMQQLLEDK